MARFCFLAVVVFTALLFSHAHAGGEKDIEIKGALGKDDPKDKIRNGPAKAHAIKLKAGTRYTFDMTGAGGGFDPYLRLLDPKGNQLEEDDDSGGDLNARIIFNCNQAGDYTVVCTTYAADMKGNYTLTIKTGVGNPKPVNAHTQMVGQPAPDIQGNFAVNGNSVKLSDLKGKVVLVHFGDVRSTSSIAILPKLAEWKKSFGGSGFTVLGVTFYTSDIGQSLGFDKSAGKVVSVEKADRKSDQELLRAFAAHHKIDYPLLALTRQNALDTYDAYIVNGVPQLVLVDRAGLVRMIDIGGEKTSANVETEIKKLLTSK